MKILTLEIEGLGCTPWKINMEPKTTQLKRKIIFQTIIFKFHVNLPGCISFSGPFPALESWGERKGPPHFFRYFLEGRDQGWVSVIIGIGFAVRVERKPMSLLISFVYLFFKQHVCLASLDSPVHEWKGGLPTSTW